MPSGFVLVVGMFSFDFACNDFVFVVQLVALLFWRGGFFVFCCCLVWIALLFCPFLGLCCLLVCFAGLCMMGLMLWFEFVLVWGDLVLTRVCLLLRVGLF